MFDMTEIGRRIATYRKEKGLTQMGLANQLGVSYQAVSNWERGESMPDIAKLEDLSRELGVSIDAILGNDKKSRAAEVLSRGEMPEDIKEVLPELLPVMTPQQIEESVEVIKDDTLDVCYLVAIAPFVERATISELALKLEGEVPFGKLLGLAPFVTKDVVNTLLEKQVTEALTVSQLLSVAPFADKKIISARALALDEECSPMQICGLAPFLEKGVTDQVIKTCVQRPLTPNEQMSLFPFLERETLAQLLKEQLEKEEN